MVQIAVMAANVNGDIGAQGISRLHWQRVDANPITVADCNAAAAAWRKCWAVCGTSIPTGVVWTWQSTVTVIEHATATIQGILSLGVTPAAVAGAASGNYPAGNGARINWLTPSLSGRRLMRAANYMVPLSVPAYSTNGQLSAAFVGLLGPACATLLADMATAQLELVAYSRPKKGQTSGGHVGLVTGYRIPLQPASLRSRRQ